MIDLSIIIVSYNTKELTLDSLQSVFEQTEGLTYEVIVLDNDSSDGSVEAIKQAFPDVNLIACKQNHGFAKGNNIASKEASGEYLLLLNPDTVVLDGAIQKLYKFAQANPDAGIWGGRTLFGDMSLNPASCWRKMTLWNVFCRSFGFAWLFPNSAIFNTEAYGGWDRSTVQHVDIVSGCFFMLRRELWEKLDCFSLQFFMYGEEADLCLRAKELYGAMPMVTPDATIIHYGSASQKVRADKMVQLLKAKRLLMKNHWSAWKYRVGMLICPLYPFNRALVLEALGLIKTRCKDEAKDWREIWRRRKEWL